MKKSILHCRSSGTQYHELGKKRGMFLGQKLDSPVLKISTFNLQLCSQHSEYALLTKYVQNMLEDLAISCDVETQL